MWKPYKKTAIALFGSIADKYKESFKALEPSISGSGLGILLRTWVCVTLFTSVIAFLISLAAVIIIDYFIFFGFTLFLYLAVFVPILTASFVFMFFYLYPSTKARSIEKSIEIDMPFALSHMSAIASSGIPPEFMFGLLIGFEEYKGISSQARLIVRNIRTYGMSSVAAIEDVAEKTPSPALKQVLEGMGTTIEKGGNMVEYLRSVSGKAIFEYRMKREQYLKTLSTYADIYTALLVAAPLMMLAVLGVMSIIGGEILGFSIGELIQLITWVVLPFLNVAFLAFIHITYPGV